MCNIRVLILLVTLAAWGCKKDDTYTGTPVAMFSRLEVETGDNQSGYFGEFLADSIILYASALDYHRKYLIRFEMILGNGTIETGYYNRFDNSVKVDSTGILKIKWKLGCNSTIQKIEFLLYVDSAKNQYGHPIYFNRPSDSLIVTANGIKKHGWARACGCENFESYRAKIISYDNNTLYLISRGLYSSSDNGMNWTKMDGIPNWEEIVDAQFNSMGWLYVLTWTHGICFSKDLKQWQFINNGLLDYRDPTAFLVEDSALFVSFYFDGPYKTTNNGEFWRKLLVGGEGEDRYYCITRHPNGDVYLIDKWYEIWISKDYGKFWNQLSIDYAYTGGSLFDLKIGNNGWIYIGGSDAIISILDPTTYQGEVHKYYQWNGSSQDIKQILITNDNVYYLVRGTPRPGIYSKLNNWDLLDIGFTGDIIYYYLKSDNRFLIVSYDGLYYYNEN